MERLSLRYNLQYFAKEGPGGEKTEDATSKKLEKAREDGQVAKSQDLTMAVSLLAMFYSIKIFVGYMGNRFLENFHGSYNIISTIVSDEFTYNTAHTLVKSAMKEIILITGPLALIGFFVAFIVTLAQVKWKPSAKPLEPKLNRLNPISGFKNIFSGKKVIELIKSLGKIGVIAYLAYDTLKDKWALLTGFYAMSFYDAIALIGQIILDLGVKISIFFLAIGLFDIWYQTKKFKDDQKMTKQEVKDEYKQTEGDPQIKGKIRQKMREVSQQRMMQSLPDADVVITNPTHLAVAVQYDKESGAAPVVIAKGADYLAQRIKQVAKENNVEIVENKPLARMLYHNVELGEEIPAELYQMVAEVLAYVYNLKGKI